MGPIVTVIVLILGGYFPFELLLAAAILQGFYAGTYMVGAWRNLRDTKRSLSWPRKAVIYVGSLIMMPVASAIEGAAILYAIVRPVKTFDVVHKN